MRLFLFSLLLCCVQFDAFAKTVSNPPFQVDVFADTPMRCIGGTASIYAVVNGGTPPYTYNWSSGQTGFYITVSTQGNHSVWVYDSAGDSGFAQISVPIEGFPSPLLATDIITECEQTGITTSQSHYNTTGSWSNVQLNYGLGWVNYANNYGISCFVPGNYQVSIDEGGCIASTNVIIPLQTHKTAIVSTEASCSNIGIGKVTVHSVTGTVFTTLGSPGQSIPYTEIILRNVSGSVIKTLTIIGSTNLPYTYTGIPPGNDYFLIRKSYEGSAPANCSDCIDTLVTGISVPTLPGLCGTISGNVYLDYNKDCIKNGTDFGARNAIVTFSPSGETVNTDPSGNFFAAMPYGTYSTTWSTPYSSFNECPLSSNFTLSASTQNVIMNLADTISAIRDKKINIYSGINRVGFDATYSIRITNLTANFEGGSIVDFYFDPILSFVSSTITPSLNQPGHLRWTGSSLNLQALAAMNILVVLNVPPNPALNGYVVNSSATINAASGEVNLNNNSTVYSVPIVTSFDPNEKRVLPTGFGPQGYISQAENTLNYIIDFQNTGSDTAFTVMILDTLSTNLDLQSFRAGPSSHNYRFSMSGNGIIKFFFDNILLPDSTTNEANSHGFVGFEIKLKPNLQPGTAILNTAYNYFDFNLPVATNTVINTIDLTTSSTTHSILSKINIYPNPGNKLIYIGSDESNEMHRITLIDISGKIILQKSINLNDRFSTELNVESIRAGLYFILIDSKAGRRSLKFSKLND